MKEKVLTKVAKKVEVDMGQFKGLSQLVKDDVETGFEALELEKTKRMKQKAKKEVIQYFTQIVFSIPCGLNVLSLSSLCFG